MGELLLVNTFGLASFIMVIYVFALGQAAMHAYAMSFSDSHSAASFLQSHYR